MKFVFPQNYSFKSKLFGFIDYSTLFLNIIWDFFVFCILDIFKLSLTIKIAVFIIFCFPLFLFSVVGFYHENFIYVLTYLLKFILHQKIYFYNKN